MAATRQSLSSPPGDRGQADFQEADISNESHGESSHSSRKARQPAPLCPLARTPACLDAFLTDDDIQGGLFPRLGGEDVRTISVLATFIETDRGRQT